MLDIVFKYEEEGLPTEEEFQVSRKDLKLRTWERKISESHLKKGQQPQLTSRMNNFVKMMKIQRYYIAIWTRDGLGSKEPLNLDSVLFP